MGYAECGGICFVRVEHVESSCVEEMDGVEIIRVEHVEALRVLLLSEPNDRADTKPLDGFLHGLDSLHGFASLNTTSDP